MDHPADPANPSSLLNLVIVGLGPAGLDRVPRSTLQVLSDPRRQVILRTQDHPAAAELAAQRRVYACDDLYEKGEDFEAVYKAIASRVVESARAGPVVYATPGSPLVGERAVGMIRSLAAQKGINVTVHPAESFVEAALAELGVDPLEQGLTLLNAHRLPSPLLLRGPTLVAALDTPVGLADFCGILSRVLADGAQVTVLVDVGGEDQKVIQCDPGRVDPGWAGPRTSLYLDVDPVGVAGAVAVMQRLRSECPWDRRQTHRSLVKNLLEETYELVEALGNLPEEAGVQGSARWDDSGDWQLWAEVCEELGDVLLQVLFHAVMAQEAGKFDIEDVAEGLRRKLVRRHPHVFADVVVDSAEQVKANWERIKAEEKSGEKQSLMDGVPLAIPALALAAKIQRRAAQVGFDWNEAPPVLEKVEEELEEVRVALADPQAARGELGDLLFACVNLARHLEADAEVALRRATAKFSDRFRLMETQGPLEGLTSEQLEQRWEQAKLAEGRV